MRIIQNCSAKTSQNQTTLVLGFTERHKCLFFKFGWWFVLNIIHLHGVQYTNSVQAISCQYFYSLIQRLLSACLKFFFWNEFQEIISFTPQYTAQIRYLTVFENIQKLSISICSMQTSLFVTCSAQKQCFTVLKPFLKSNCVSPLLSSHFLCRFYSE